jgi:hypothetical protein
MLFIFSTPGLVRHQWQFKTVVFMHSCLICNVLLEGKLNTFAFSALFHYAETLYFVRTVSWAARAYLSEASFRLERLAMDMHSSLIRKSVNYDREDF